MEPELTRRRRAGILPAMDPKPSSSAPERSREPIPGELDDQALAQVSGGVISPRTLTFTTASLFTNASLLNLNVLGPQESSASASRSGS